MGTHYRGIKEEIISLDAFIKLIRAAGSVSSRVEAHLASIELTVSQFGVLEALYHLGPLHQKDLAAKILKSTGNITMVVDNLEKRGLVARSRDENDRRHRIVRITEQGRGLLWPFFPAHVRRIVEEMKALSPSEQKTLGRLCKKVGLGKASGTGGKGST